MAEFKRTADATWNGDLRGGRGRFSGSSGAFKNVPYSFTTRFEDTPGSNPEELIAAAHAACYSMAFAAFLAGQGHQPESISTHAVCTIKSKEGGGWQISAMRLEVRGRVPGLDSAAFGRLAHEAEAGCPVSNLLKSGLTITIDAQLE